MRNSQLHDCHNVRNTINMDTLLAACAKTHCEQCDVELSEDQIRQIIDRPFVVEIDNRDEPSLYMCSHCTYHNVRCRPLLCEARFTRLGAPLNLEDARAFCRMLGDTKEKRFIIVIVPSQ